MRNGANLWTWWFTITLACFKVRAWLHSSIHEWHVRPGCRSMNILNPKLHTFWAGSFTIVFWRGQKKSPCFVILFCRRVRRFRLSTVLLNQEYIAKSGRGNFPQQEKGSEILKKWGEKRRRQAYHAWGGLEPSAADSTAQDDCTLCQSQKAHTIPGIPLRHVPDLVCSTSCGGSKSWDVFKSCGVIQILGHVKTLRHNHNWWSAKSCEKFKSCAMLKPRRKLKSWDIFESCIFWTRSPL